MFKTEITYPNFIGDEVTETLRFNLSEAELMDLVQTNPKFSTDYLSYIVHEQNIMAMVEVTRMILHEAFGVMSEDGKFFRKKPEDVYDFEHSAAYNALIDKIIYGDDAEYFKDMMFGIFPEKFAKEIAAGQESVIPMIHTT